MHDFYCFFFNLVILFFKEGVLEGCVKVTHLWIFFPCVWIFPLSSICGRYTGSRGLFLLYTLDAAQGLLTAPAQAERRV